MPVMKACNFFIIIILLFTSCSSYRFASKYASNVLQNNGLVFHVLDNKNYNLTYWDSETDKPPLLLIHGFGTSGKFQWYKESDDLSDNYRLIIVNLFYFGSEPKTPTYSVDGQAKAIEVLLRKLNINSLFICGSSYGGLVAAEFTLDNPEKVKKLVLMDTPLKYLTETDIKKVCEKYDIKDREELFVPSDPAMFKKLTSITYLKGPRLPNAMVRSFYKHTYQEEKDNLHNIYLSLLKEKEILDSKNYNFKIPVLLIWGEEDRLVPLHVARELQEHIGKNARLEIIPKAAHLPNLENEKEVNKTILSFLKD
jgi:pimeloyl-ACP methyl ester carboxylesterase